MNAQAFGDQSPKALMPSGHGRERHAAICRWLLRVRRQSPAAASASLPEATLRALAPNPYHEILLELYLAELEGRPIYQSELTGAGPLVSTHRRVGRLERLGVVVRFPDARDQRRLNVRLTPAMVDLVEFMIDRLACEARGLLADRP